MIRVQKGASPAVLVDEGAAFQKNAVLFAAHQPYDKDYKESFEAHGSFDAGGRFEGFSSKLFTTYKLFSHATVKQQLITEHFGKCVFCETFMLNADTGDVEHFRPKSEVTILDHNVPSERTKVEDHPGYYWLSQTWDNLFLSCKQCNQSYKGTLFDVYPDTPRALPGGADGPMLLYPGPGDIDPRSVLRFNLTTAEAVPVEGGPGSAQDNMARAARTIQIVGLNRPRLIEVRAAHLVKLRSHFILAAMGAGAQPDDGADPNILAFQFQSPCAGSDAVDALRLAVLPSAEFSALAQDAILAWNRELRLGTVPVQVSLLEYNNVRMNQASLRMNDQIALAEARRAANENAAALEAEPDTSDLDQEYNALLKRYKAAVTAIRGDWDDIVEEHRLAGPLDLEIAPLTAEIAPLQRELDEIDALLDEVEQVNRYLILVNPTQEGRTEMFAQLDEAQRYHLDRMAHMEPGARDERIARARVLCDHVDGARARRLELVEALEPLDARRDLLFADRDRVREIIETHTAVLDDIDFDLGGVIGGYQRRGASGQQRQARCMALQAAIANLSSHLDDLGVPLREINIAPVKRFHVSDHLARGVGWPPAINGA